MSRIAEKNRPKLLQQLARMMDQQFWRWGCDVKHDVGKLLVRYGKYNIAIFISQYQPKLGSFREGAQEFPCFFA